MAVKTNKKTNVTKRTATINPPKRKPSKTMTSRTATQMNKGAVGASKPPKPVARPAAGSGKMGGGKAAGGKKGC